MVEPGPKILKVSKSNRSEQTSIKTKIGIILSSLLLVQSRESIGARVQSYLEYTLKPCKLNQKWLNKYLEIRDFGYKYNFVLL